MGDHACLRISAVGDIGGNLVIYRGGALTAWTGDITKGEPRGGIGWQWWSSHPRPNQARVPPAMLQACQRGRQPVLPH